jgi:hypothetical protein
VIAADRRTLKASEERGTPDTGVYCALRSYDGIGVAFAGMLAEGSTRFDVTQIARIACRGGGTIFDKFTRFDALVAPRLSVAWARIFPDTTDPARISPLDVAFCGMFEGMGIVLLGRLTRGPHLEVIRSFRLPRSGELTSVQLFFLGGSEGFVRQARAPGGTPGRDLLRMPIDLLEEELATRHATAGSIDALHISNTGARWLHRGEECVERE